MRRLACVSIASALLLFSFAAAAAAKGPSEATIFGPGMDGPTSLSGDAETGAPTEFGDLVDRSGFFFSLFRSPSSPITDRPPEGELGPQYTVEYVVPWQGHEYRIIQLLYPFAAGGPVTFVDPAQDGPDEGGVHGGWYLASDRLLDTHRHTRANLASDAPALCAVTSTGQPQPGP
ncbi:MAG TPA: hypothetical protein VML96_11650, partial [Egibacteraceae bacterium]|nr:hypothetical protein [Egibacteraceae bacterium]